MKFGVREICDVVFKAKAAQKVGNKIFYKGEPVIYFDTLKTSTLEGAATTVYAQGGRGNSRLVAWEGERTVTFTMEDALISPAGFMILSGAGLVEPSGEKIEVVEKTIKKTVTVEAESDSAEIELPEAPLAGTKVTYSSITKGQTGYTEIEGAVNAVGNKITISGLTAETTYDFTIRYNVEETVAANTIPVHVVETTDDVDVAQEEITITVKQALSVDKDATIYVMVLEDGEVITEPYIGERVDANTISVKSKAGYTADLNKFKDKNGNARVVLVDYYTDKTSGAQQINITPDKFGGNYYVEASTLFRNQNGVDMPAEFIIPNCKVQSNFTFTMASSGDPSTFTFTLDAFPDYTRFDKTKKVLAAIQIINETDTEELANRTATIHASAHDKYFED